MDLFNILPAGLVTLSIPVIGLGSAWLTRLFLGSKTQTSSQLFFILCMLLVGSLAIVLAMFNTGSWLMPGATFSLMIVIATCDFRRQPVPHWEV